MMASHPSQKRSWRMTTFVLDGTVMKLRSGGRQGYGGSFPKASTSSAPLAWDARLNGGSGSAGFSSIVAIGTTRASAGAPVSRAGAHLYVHGNFFFFYGPKANSSGVAIVPLVSHVPASVTGFPLPIHLQGALGTMAVLKLTNSQTLKL